MTTKFHVNAKGEAGKCSATQGKCPFGGDEAHYLTKEAAQNAAEKSLTEENTWEPQKKGELPAHVTALMEEISQLENNPARHHYGLPEDEQTRYNINKKIGDLKDDLRKTIPFADFALLRSTVRSEDMDEAVKQQAVQLGNTPDYSWEKVMGTGTRRMPNAVQNYERQLQARVRNSPTLKATVARTAAVIRDQRLFARAFKESVPLPERYETALEKVWTGTGVGSEKHTIQAIKELEADKTAYAEGRLAPAKIVGNGLRNPRAEADKYLARRTEELNEQIRTRGRSNTVTASNVMAQGKREGW